jgi:DNA-binding response OmpR family regulator
MTARPRRARVDAWFDLILLDVMRSGRWFQVCRELRRRHTDAHHPLTAVAGSARTAIGRG